MRSFCCFKVFDGLLMAFKSTKILSHIWPHRMFQCAPPPSPLGLKCKIVSFFLDGSPNLFVFPENGRRIRDLKTVIYD